LDQTAALFGWAKGGKKKLTFIQVFVWPYSCLAVLLATSWSTSHHYPKQNSLQNKGCFWYEASPFFAVNFIPGSSWRRGHVSSRRRWKQFK